MQKLASDLGREELRSGTVYEGQLDDYTYYYEYYSGSKNRPSYFRVWLPCSSGGTFSVGREGWLERLSKRLGISVEIQTGDSAFDREFYVATDTVHFTREALASPDVRDSIKAVRAAGYPRIKLDGGNIEARRSPFTPSRDAVRLEVDPVARELRKLAGRMPPGSLEPRLAGIPAWKLRRNAVYACSGGLIAAGFGLLLLGLNRYPPLHAGEVFLYSIRVVGPLLLLFIVVAVRLLKGRSSSHRDVLLNLLFSVIGFPLAGFGGAMVWNGAADAAGAAWHDALVTGKHYTTSRNSRTYYVELTSWNGDPGGEKIKVSHGVYRRARPGRSVLTVGTRPGRLGFEWVSGYRIRKTP